MAIELKQQLKLTQQLVMTPQLQQAIKLLQLSRLELVDVVQQELTENPVLEETVEVEEDLPAEIRDDAHVDTQQASEPPEEGEPTHLTCSTTSLRRPRRFVAGTPRARAS